MYEDLNARKQDVESEVTYAGWLRRVAGSLIDTAALLALLFVGLMLVAVGDSGGPGSEATFVAILLAWTCVALLYDPICHAAWQQTLGKRLLGLRVVRPSGARIGFGRAVWRHLAKLVLGMVPILGLLDHLNPLSSKSNQTVHDRIASTVVVRSA